LECPALYLYQDLLAGSGAKARAFLRVYPRLAFFPEVLGQEAMAELCVPLK